MFWRVVALACLFASAPPGAQGRVDDPVDCPGSCERPIAYTLDAAFGADERAVVEQAMRAWERGTAGRVCFAQGGRDLVVEKVEDAEDLQPWDPDWALHIGFTKGGHIWIVAADVSDRGKLRALVMHEIGHHLGLTHVDDPALTYMHPLIGDTSEELRENARLPERDRRAFCAVHSCTCALNPGS